MVVLGRAVPLSIIIVLYTFSTVAIGDSSSYLSEGIVAESRLDSKDQQQDAVVNNETNSDVVKKQWAWEGSLVGDALPKGMKKDEFIALLEKRFYGSFILYRRLPVADQELIYIGYKAYSDPNINDIRKAILKYKT